MDKNDFPKLYQKYKALIEDDLMRFWERAFDTEHGGIYTCFSNDGSKLLSTDKYVWSQGRMLWILSRLCEMHDRGMLCLPREEYARQAAKTRDFILNYSLLPEEGGVCAYLLEADGTKKESIPGKGYYTSYFVDCFVIMGLMEYARVFRDEKTAEAALAIYKGMMSYLDRGEIRSEPYPVKKGFRPHSKSMILCNVCGVSRDALKALEHPRAAEFEKLAFDYMQEVVFGMYNPENGLIKEMICDATDEYDDTVLARHAAPGHGNEDMWFCMEAAGEDEKSLAQIYRIVKASMAVGWDKEYGGVFRFCDKDGGAPKGRRIGDPYENLVIDTWDTKLWWVHAECLYTTLRCYAQTGDPEFAEWYQKLDEYVFSHFPNPNREIGEWIQILDRRGRPLNKVVALPVKDPYHILRDVMLIVELLCRYQ